MSERCTGVLVLLPLLVLFAALPVPLQAQTIDDGIMMAKHDLHTGGLYSYENWDQYWEGSLKRENGNLGSVTTQADVWSTNYGVTDRLNVIAAIPYVWTHPSQGVLRGMKGYQDFTVAGKYSFLVRPFTKSGTLRAIAVISASVPLTDYTPDFQPLSLGSASRRGSGRVTLNFQSNPGWFVNGSTAYTLRAKVTLDRPYYFTDGEFVMSSDVPMPDVFDYAVSAGYMKRGLMTAFTVSQQRTLGGGDIRRQDMPFVSNRMNFAKLGAVVVYPLPKLRDLSFRFAYAYTVAGRNVGQATALTTGLLYTLHFGGRPTP